MPEDCILPELCNEYRHMIFAVVSAHVFVGPRKTTYSEKASCAIRCLSKSALLGYIEDPEIEDPEIEDPEIV